MFQILLDLVKLLTKETFLIPRPTSVLAPVFLTLFFTVQLLFAHNYVWGPSMFLFENVDSMILYHLILILFSNIFFTVIGLLSQSRYALIAIARSLVHVISLDIFVTVVYSLLVFSTQSTSFHDFVITQNYFWFFVLFSPIAFGFVILFLLESKRTPFDHAETEAEVVAGYSTEYNGNRVYTFSNRLGSLCCFFLRWLISIILFMIFTSSISILSRCLLLNRISPRVDVLRVISLVFFTLFTVSLECLPGDYFYTIETSLFVDHFTVVLKHLWLFNWD